MATLVLSGIEFEGRHGHTAAERRINRKFIVDVEVERDVSPAQRSDAIRDTVDFRQIAETIVEIGSGEPCRLLEALASRMLDALAARIPGARFRIELKKPNPPGCPGYPAYASVRISRP